jgi:hypothetical protein
VSFPHAGQENNVEANDHLFPDAVMSLYSTKKQWIDHGMSTTKKVQCVDDMDTECRINVSTP